jgi:FixJ family two-component response regulator
MEWNSIMDFLEKTIEEQKLLDISYKQSKQNKADRHLESFSDDLRNSIIKKVKKMIRPYTPEEEEILRKGLKENNNG